jgi:hypothetical protein
MIRHCLFIWFFLLLNNNAIAQFINLQIRVEPELSATVEQNLSFGQLVINSGVSEVELGDLNMGIFNIRAYYTQNIYVSIEYPEFLTHENPAIEDNIPLTINASYNNSGNRNINNSTLLVGNSGYLPVSERATRALNNNQEFWEEIYLYIYGSINVGNINEGEYSGEILLLIEYD